MVNSEEYITTEYEPNIVGFVCNWSAYSSVEMAGVEKREYPASIKLVRLMCLGRLNLGLILKAFELGADGVMLLGCPPDDCHYESGATRAREVFNQAVKVVTLLGIDHKRLALLEMPLGRGDLFASKVSSFTRQVKKIGSSPLSPPNNISKELVKGTVS